MGLVVTVIVALVVGPKVCCFDEWCVSLDGLKTFDGTASIGEYGSDCIHTRVAFSTYFMPNSPPRVAPMIITITKRMIMIPWFVCHQNVFASVPSSDRAFG